MRQPELFHVMCALRELKNEVTEMRARMEELFEEMKTYGGSAPNLQDLLFAGEDSDSESDEEEDDDSVQSAPAAMNF
tara:strand:+ start:182 stop:412 length:231 start_codon:yes stop_codon:yes gene_type:complete